MEIKYGQVQILVGPNGSGKTNTLEELLHKNHNSRTHFWNPYNLRPSTLVNPKKDVEDLYRRLGGQSLPSWVIYTWSRGELCLLSLCDLLCNIKDGDLVLLDDVGVSFHISINVSLLDLFLEIAEQKQAAFVITTHSPDIIQDRWDLVVEL